MEQLAGVSVVLGSGGEADTFVEYLEEHGGHQPQQGVLVREDLDAAVAADGTHMDICLDNLLGHPGRHV